MNIELIYITVRLSTLSVKNFKLLQISYLLSYIYMYSFFKMNKYFVCPRIYT